MFMDIGFYGLNGRENLAIYIKDLGPSILTFKEAFISHPILESLTEETKQPVLASLKYQVKVYFMVHSRQINRMG